MFEGGMSVDDLQLEIEEKICGFLITRLEEFAQFLKVDISEHIGKGRPQVSKKLRGELEALVEENDKNDNKGVFVNSVWAFVRQAKETGEKPAATSVSDYEIAKNEYKAFQSKMNQMLETQSKLLKEAEETVKLASASQESNIARSLLQSTIIQGV